MRENEMKGRARWSPILFSGAWVSLSALAQITESPRLSIAPVADGKVRVAWTNADKATQAAENKIDDRRARLFMSLSDSQQSVTASFRTFSPAPLPRL
jgi:hypothetical protein